MKILFMVLIIYVIFAVITAMTYTYMFHLYFMPDVVVKSTRGQKIKVYATLFISAIAGAPICFYELLKTKKNGGFTK